MFGYSFLVKNGKKYHFNTENNMKKCIETEDFICFNNMIDKFKGDKVFQQNKDYFIVLDGVVLNKKDFVAKYPNKGWFEILIILYELLGDDFYNDFRGSFSGVLFDKRRNRYVIFSDHIGSKFMYYVKLEDALFVSSMVSECYLFLKQNKISYSLNIENAYLLLSYGYMIEDRTLCDSIFKIQPGCYLCYSNYKISEYQYFLLDNTPDNNVTELDALEMMNNCYRHAIQLEFDKDIECGYKKHLVALSAGLDSRMVTWVAHEMGYANQLNVTFSQTEYWDQIVPQKISSDLKHEWIFKALDNGLWLYDVDEITKITGGNVIYYGSAHGRSLSRYLDLDTLGIFHSGQQGDIAFDTYYTGKDINKQFILGEGAFSYKYLNRIDNIRLRNTFKNEEIAHYYYRSFSGANHGNIHMNLLTEVKSPFADVDLLLTILKVPLQYRRNRNLYFKWIIQYYPNAAKYVWDHIGCRIDRKYGMIKRNNKLPIRVEEIPNKVFNKIFKRNTFNTKNHMNPIGYYIMNNEDLRLWIDMYFDNNIDLISDKTLKNDILDIKRDNNYKEKIQALSLLSALKLFY